MVLLAVFAAAMWGTGNFEMGRAVRGSSPRATVIVGFGSGLCAAIALYVLQRPHLDPASFGWGILAGLAQGFGWLAFARALKLTRIGVVAPLAATTTVMSLCVTDLVTGAHITSRLILGGALALVAIVLLCGRTTDNVRALPTRSRPAYGGVAAALVAGLLFAGQAEALVRAGTTSSSIVLLGTGSGVLVLMLVTLLVAPMSSTEFRAAGGWAVSGGVTIFVGDACYLYALAQGVPAVATVVAQMHPLVTSGLASVFLRERLSRRHILGILLAVAGVAVISSAS